MTGFWIAAALLTAAIVVLVARPLVRRAVPGGTGGDDLSVYRDQLSELERDRARGLIEPEQAAPLEAEIGRRMLSAARAASPAPTMTVPARRLAVAVITLFPITAVLVYLAVGHPDIPGLPLAERELAQDVDPAKMLAAVDQMKSKLKEDPADLDRWVMVGQAYARLGRPREAVDALRMAVKLAPDDPSLSAILAETLISADGGAVGEEAKQRFKAIPSDSPALPEARYYLALADAQAGDMKSALKGWQGLLADSPADAGWIDQTRARIAAAAEAMGLDPAKETPEPKPVATSAPAPSPDGRLAAPDAAQAQAIQQMNPDQQSAMIRGMVDRLAARLEANPDDPAGWRQLARAYTVLGEADKAKAAQDHAAAAEAKGAKN